MSKQQANEEAVRQALEKLSGIDIVQRTLNLGFSPPDEKGNINLRVFGRDMILNNNFELLDQKTMAAAKISDLIVLLHYLCCDVPISENGVLVSFRDLPGGIFYWEPFQSRSVKPLVSKIKNDVALLEKNLYRFDWERRSMGDFSAKIHAFGKIHLTIVYHLGDEEFGPSADVLFDSCVKRSFSTEDAAVVASRICIGLM